MPKLTALLITSLIGFSAAAAQHFVTVDEAQENWLARQHQITCSMNQQHMKQVTNYVEKKFAPQHQGWSGCTPLHASGSVIGCEFSTGDGMYCYGTPGSGNTARLDCYRNKPTRNMSEGPDSYACGY